MEKICKTDGISMKIIDQWGTIRYYNKNNKLHRKNRPAVEHPDGNKAWYKNGVRHREDGPAIEFANGTKEWYKNGLLHREDGPAVEFADGDKEYWYNDVEYSEIRTDEEWTRFIKLLVFQ